MDCRLFRRFPADDHRHLAGVRVDHGCRPDWFIGLLTPNIVRVLGARTPRMELVASVVFGALLLLLTDMLAQWLTLWFGQVVPSGVTAAAIGAPALIWFSRRQLKAQDGIAVALPGSRQRVSRGLSVTVAALLMVGWRSISVISQTVRIPGWRCRVIISGRCAGRVR